VSIYIRFYLTSVFTAIKKRTDTATKVPDNQILELGFERYCEEHRLERVSGNTIYNWLDADFGIGSSKGYTTLHPRKTDACDTCCKIALDTRSVEASIKRHSQQQDQTLERIETVRALKEQLEDLRTARDLHIETADQSKSAYNAAHSASTPEVYESLTRQFNGLPLSEFSDEVNYRSLAFLLITLHLGCPGSLGGPPLGADEFLFGHRIFLRFKHR
jgi:hypothetical protein